MFEVILTDNGGTSRPENIEVNIETVKLISLFYTEPFHLGKGQ